MQKAPHCSIMLTFWCLLPRNSGCGVAPPTAGHPQCQRWKRQRSRGGGRFPAWAGCPTEGSPESAYLVGEKKKRFQQKKWNMSYVQMFQAHACDSWTRPRVKTQFDNLYWSRGLAGDRFVPMADLITSGDKTPSDSLTLSFPTGFNPCNLPTASIIRARAVSVRPLLSGWAILSSSESEIQSLRSAPCTLPLAALSHWRLLPLRQPKLAVER